MKLTLHRDTGVAGVHVKAGEVVDIPKGDAAYLIGHKIAFPVVHRDVTKVTPALPLPAMKPAPTNDDEDVKKGGK